MTDSKSDGFSLLILQLSQPLLRINLSDTRVSVFPEGEEFLVVLYNPELETYCSSKFVPRSTTDQYPQASFLFFRLV